MGFGISEQYEQVQIIGELIDPEGREACRLFRYEAILVGHHPEDPLSIPFCFECRNILFTDTGDYLVRIKVDGMEMATMPLRVTLS